MRLRRIVLLICLLGTLVGLGVTPQKAMACGGPPITFQAEFEQHDIFAQGTIIESDDLGQNVVVRVKTYYKGSGPETLLFIRRFPEDIQGLLVGPVDCTSLKTPLFRGDKIYFSASRRADGSYESAKYFEDADYRYNSPADINGVILRNPDPNSYLIQGGPFNETQFQELVEKTSGVTPIPPEVSGTFPLFSPLLILTHNSKYLLPIDGSPPVKLEQTPHSNVYNSGLEYPIIFDGERCLGRNCTLYHPLQRYEMDVVYIMPDYDAALVAPDAHLIAFWTQTGLDVRLLEGQDFSDTSTSLNEDSEKTALKLSQNAQWSPDGQQLVYSDIKGLWLWDVYNQDSKPRLLRSTAQDGAIPTARYFSPRGRYLAIAEGNKLSTLDLRTDTSLPDGLFSPDEQLFIAFDKRDSKTGLISISVCKPEMFKCELIRGGEDFEAVKQIEWTGNKTLLALVDPSHSSVSQSQDTRSLVNKFNPSTGYLLRDLVVDFYDYGWIEYPPYSDIGQRPETQLDKGFVFDFDLNNHTLALTKNGSTVVINRQDRNLKPYLDGDIVSIHWLPSLLYREGR